MITSKTLGSRISQAVIWVLVIAMALICLLPLLNMVAISFSSSTAASASTSWTPLATRISPRTPTGP